MNQPRSNPDAGEPETAPAGDGLTLLQLMHSALMAAIGVQSSENRKRDFARGKPWQFILMGILFTTAFVLLVVGVVNLVLSRVL